MILFHILLGWITVLTGRHVYRFIVRGAIALRCKAKKFIALTLASFLLLVMGYIYFQPMLVFFSSLNILLNLTNLLTCIQVYGGGTE